MKKIFSTLAFIVLAVCNSLAQDRPIDGLVFDKETKQRLTRVYIYNLRSNKGFFNTSKGEFKTTVRGGDTLVAALEGYAVDTTTVKTQNTIVFYLKRTSILLKEVVVRDSLYSPAKKRKGDQEAYQDIYRKGNASDIFSIGGSNGMAGAGLSIDALYSLLSKEGKNARYLQQILERDYREAMIDYRFSKKLVNNATELTGETLEDFMQQYRPSYYFILDANDYSLIKYIKESYRAYIKNPAAHRLPPLIRP